MKERWADIPDYEGLYQISEFGRVRSLDRLISGARNNSKRRHRGRILKISHYTNGYCFVGLSKNGVVKQHLIHRLVLLSFCEANCLEINHRDGNKDNNALGNLEYVTHSYNQLHSYRVLKRSPNAPYLGKRGFEHNKSKAVKIMDLLSDTTYIFGSRRIASDNGFDRQTIKRYINTGKLFRNRFKFIDYEK